MRTKVQHDLYRAAQRRVITTVEQEEGWEVTKDHATACINWKPSCSYQGTIAFTIYLLFIYYIR
jgi:hypothetical protein